MIERYACVDVSNVVDNIALWDGVTPWVPDHDCVAVRIGAQVCDRGYVYDPITGLFSSPV